MSLKIEDNALRATISSLLTPAEVSRIATMIGFNSKANFTPGEYAALLEQTTRIVVAHVSGAGQQSQAISLRERAQPIVDETLSKECKRTPRDCSYIELPPFLQRWLSSILSGV